MATFITGSYLTNAEFEAAPTALAVNALVPGGDQAAQDNELAGLVSRASRWIDSVARQPLYATQTTNQRERVRLVDGPSLQLRAYQDRVVSVDALAWGPQPNMVHNTLTAPITAWIEEQRILVPLASSGVVWAGSLNAMATPVLGTPVYVVWSYTAGWPTTVLTAQANSGATTVTVSDPTGITNGQVLTLANGADTTTAQVSSVSGSTVTLTATLTETWPSGSGLSAVPADIKEAAILVVSHYIKMRAAGGWAMAKDVKVETATAKDLSPELEQAREIALRYQRQAP